MTFFYLIPDYALGKITPNIHVGDKLKQVKRALAQYNFVAKANWIFISFPLPEGQGYCIIRVNDSKVCNYSAGKSCKNIRKTNVSHRFTD